MPGSIFSTRKAYMTEQRFSEKFLFQQLLKIMSWMCRYKIKFISEEATIVYTEFQGKAWLIAHSLLQLTFAFQNKISARKRMVLISWLDLVRRTLIFPQIYRIILKCFGSLQRFSLVLSQPYYTMFSLPDGDLKKSWIPRMLEEQETSQFT